MGGRGANASRNTGIKNLTSASPFLSREEMEAVRKDLNYHLPVGAESATLLSVGNVDKDGYADVEYELNLRVSYTEVDSDGMTHTVSEIETQIVTDRRKVR